MLDLGVTHVKILVHEFANFGGWYIQSRFFDHPGSHSFGCVNVDSFSNHFLHDPFNCCLLMLNLISFRGDFFKRSFLFEYLSHDFADKGHRDSKFFCNRSIFLLFYDCLVDNLNLVRCFHFASFGAFFSQKRRMLDPEVFGRNRICFFLSFSLALPFLSLHR